MLKSKNLLTKCVQTTLHLDNEIVFEEKKDYKTFSEKFKVGK